MNNKSFLQEISTESQESYTREVIRMVRSGKKLRDEIIGNIFHDTKLRNIIYNFVLKSGGKQEDAKSIFNISLVKFVKTVMKNENIQITNSINSYIVGIAKFSWYDELAKKQKVKKSDFDIELEELSPSPEILIINQEKKELLHDILELMRKNCKEVLIHWASGFSMEKIAKLMNYKSYKMAKKKKHQCMKQLINYLAENPSIKEALL